jgi:hypothetical protein
MPHSDPDHPAVLRLRYIEAELRAIVTDLEADMAALTAIVTGAARGAVASPFDQAGYWQRASERKERLRAIASECSRLCAPPPEFSFADFTCGRIPLHVPAIGLSLPQANPAANHSSYAQN